MVAQQKGTRALHSLLLLLLATVFLNQARGTFEGSKDFGGTYWENLLETPIDLREPRSFPQSGLHVVRQHTFQELQHGKNVVKVGNWEVYTENWWYETRLVNATCPVVPIGIAATTDWSLMQLCLFGNPEVRPKTIFVHTYMLPHFAESTLKYMDKEHRFVLVSGATDMTFPRGTGDVRGYFRNRLRGFGGRSNGTNWNYIIKDPRVLHWFAENHDIAHPKLSTLPTGFTFEMLSAENQTYISPDYENKKNIKLPLTQRALKVLTSDRLRSRAGQWETRYNVEKMCENVTWCHVPFAAVNAFEGIPHSEFIKELHLASFVSCAHGGGMDPSPKAFEAIHEGTIPIIRKFDPHIVYDAYQHLPVMWIDSWEEFYHQPEADALTLLQRWRDKLAPYYEPNSALRHATIKKLQTSYWAELINKKYLELTSDAEQGQQKEAEKRRKRHVRVRIEDDATNKLYG